MAQVRVAATRVTRMGATVADPARLSTTAICNKHMRRHGRRTRGGRIERFGVPAALLLLSERPAHGYDLLERMPELTGEERVDVGNLYRLLRTLEEQGLVRSEWDESVPGPAKRTYEITADGRAGLERWAAALTETRDRIDRFLRRYEERG